jgi:hypothetical protein
MLKRIVLDVVDVDADGIFDGITGVGPWDSDDWKEATQVNGGAPDGLAHQLNLTSGQNLSGITFTLTGTDANDRALVEAIAGPSATTIETVNYFKTLTDVVASATLSTNTLDIGYVDDVASAIHHLAWDRNVNAKMLYTETGTVSDFTVQFTVADWSDQGLYPTPEAIPWITPVSGLLNETASNTAINDVPAGYTGFRCIITGYSSGAAATLYASQPVSGGRG